MTQVAFSQQADPGSGTAPTFANFDPVPGTTGVALDKTLSIDVTSPTGIDIDSVLIELSNAGLVPVAPIFRSGRFHSPFVGPNSAVTGITNGYQFTIDPSALWPEGQTVYIILKARNPTYAQTLDYSSFYFTTAATDPGRVAVRQLSAGGNTLGC